MSYKNLKETQVRKNLKDAIIFQVRAYVNWTVPIDMYYKFDVAIRLNTKPLYNETKYPKESEHRYL